MIGLEENTSDFLGRKEDRRDKGNGATLMKRPLNIGHVPPETGNICQVLKRSQRGITLILSEENGNLVGQVEKQVTDVEKPLTPFIMPDNTTLKTKCEAERENFHDQCWPEGLLWFCSPSLLLNMAFVGFYF